MRALPWEAVLFDRDGTLVHDVPYNADPARIRAVAGARDALDALRGAGVRVGLVTNQSVIGHGWADRGAVDACHARLQEQVGPFDTVAVCPHRAEDECRCRKPAPGLVLAAAGALEVDPRACVVIGDVGSDLVAAQRAGAAAILVPTSVTRPDEVAAARFVAPTVPAAVASVLSGRSPSARADVTQVGELPVAAGGVRW